LSSVGFCHRYDFLLSFVVIVEVDNDDEVADIILFYFIFCTSRLSSPSRPEANSCGSSGRFGIAAP
jgi:hypothetical protein